MIIKNSWVRYTNGFGYTIFIFTEDLTNTITPMSVMEAPGGSGVCFITCQHRHMSANLHKEFAYAWAFLFEDIAKPLFNLHDTRMPGDSGSPNMIPMPDGCLVFIGGTSPTSGPSVQMQKDMDNLCTNSIVGLNLNKEDYQLDWHNYNP